MNFGTHTLDLLSQNNPEIFALSNTTSNAFISFYDGGSNYIVGSSNKTFSILNRSGPTSVGIGTIPNSNIQNVSLTVLGTIMTSNITTYTADSNISFGNKNLTNLSNINFTGGLYQSGLPYQSSQWTSTSNKDVIITGNVGIGSSLNSGFNFNLGSNLYIQGSVFITGQVSASNYNNLISPTTYTSLSLYNTVNNYERVILTNDSTYNNRVLYQLYLNPGRYIINGNIPYINLDNFVALDTVNWATIGIYSVTTSGDGSCGPYTSSSTLLRLTQIVSIGSSYVGDVECLSINWFIDVTSINPAWYVIAVNGKGHNLKFSPIGSPASTVFIPVRGIGYDDSISVRQSIQSAPVRVNITTSGTTTTLVASNVGFFSAVSSNVELYIAGTRQNYNTYSTTVNYSNGYTSYTITPQSSIATNTNIDMIVWPSFSNISSSSFYSSGYIYQQINTSTTPFLTLPNGTGARLGSNLVIDGNIYLKGTVFPNSDTTQYTGGVTYTGVPPLNAASNIIGTSNIIDGSITASKINLLSGNLGVGIPNSLANYNIDINGSLRTSNLIFYPQYIPNSIIGIPKELTVFLTAEGVSIGTGNVLPKIRATSNWNIYQVRASLSTPSSGGLTYINIFVSGVSIFSSTNYLAINSGSSTSVTSINYQLTQNPTPVNDDAEISFTIPQSGGGTASGLKVTFYYVVR